VVFGRGSAGHFAIFSSAAFALCNILIERYLAKAQICLVRYYRWVIFTPMNASSPPEWRCFENIPCAAQAASAAASCAFSLGTLQVASSPECGSFAVTERKQPEIWRWAVIGDGGFLLEEGFEPSQEEAKRAAADALAQCRAHLA
jgi:hypothetical protein